MSDSEVNRLKTGAFTFGFETLLHRLVCVTSLFLSVSPHSSCLCHLTLLVCHLTLLVCVSSLFLSVSPHSSCLCLLTLLVCVSSLFLSVSPHSSCLCLLTLLVCVSSLFLSVSPHSSCLCHLTLLVSHLSSRDKWNLICDVEVCAGLFEVLFRTHPLPRYILFVHISAERKRDRLTNKSLVCTKVYLFYSSCQESWIYWLINVNNILLPTRNKVSQREKKLYKNCNPYYNLFCQDIIRLC